MNKIFRKSICFFVVIALFSFGNCVFAAESENENVVTPQQVLDEILEAGCIKKHQVLDDEKNVISQAYVYTTKSELLNQTVNPSTGTLTIDNKEYYFEITFNNSLGEECSLSNSSNNFVKFSDQYVHELNTLIVPSEDINYTYSLVPVDGNGDKISKVQRLEFSSNNIIDSDSERGLWAKVKKLIIEILCGITIPAGDSYLHMISSALGESVTIDKVVYNEIDKLSVDFFDDLDTDNKVSGENLGEIKPIKDIMKGTINTWYGIFRDFVLVFYMAILVYFGIKILLSSTSSKKAMYKQTLTAWGMGIAMLIFFPYVMKYAIKLNNAFCKSIKALESEEVEKIESADVKTTLWRAKDLYGTDGFIMMMLGEDIDNINEESQKKFAATAIAENRFGNNAMMEIRFIAAHKSDFPLVIIYFILIGELLALIIMYYKRIFMLGFLITIFPIMMALYPFSKIGDIKLNTFGVWFKEFVINVFVQSFHAAIYVVVVSIGINSYFSEGNWLFMILCILFLFEGEKIIRGIFGAKSSINSIGDMAAAGMMAINFAKNSQKMMPKFSGKNGAKDGNADKKAIKDRPARTSADATTPSTRSNTDAVNAIENNNSNSTSTIETQSSMAPVELGRNTSTVTVNSANQSLKDNLDNKRADRLGRWAEKTAGAVGTGGSVFLQAVGGVNGFALGMAQNDGKGSSGINKGLENAIHGIGTGKLVGGGASNLLRGVTGKVVGTAAGFSLAKEYSKGEHDDEIFTDADKQLDEAKKEALRKAYAMAARRRGAGFENAAEIKIIKERVDESEK